MKNERIAAAAAWLKEEKLAGLIAFNDGQNSFLDSNAVYVFSNLRPIGRSAVIIAQDGTSTLLIEPSWDGSRAQKKASNTRIIACDDLARALQDELARYDFLNAELAVVGLAKQSRALDRAVRAMLSKSPRMADTLASHLARIRNAEELAHVKKAVWIAERGYERLIEMAKPGMREYELAADIYTFMKELGAEDNFLLMSASQHNLAVRAAGRRILQEGDIILGEITPCYQGQFVQICRTTVLGQASPLLSDKYALLQDAMRRGLEAAVPGATMGEVTEAMNEAFRKAGYGDYCRPPYMRVRGHGLGVTSDRPGDLVDDSLVKLEEGMVFVMHPNQYIPETGYLMCGETIVISHNGGISLSDADSRLDVKIV
jgi:Xaa-Pro aminopeptidase